MKTILKKLSDGDFRSIGKSNEIVQSVLSKPELFDDLFSGILESDPLVRMRSADAIEKITAEKPELLQKFKRSILDRVAYIEQQEVQWHVAQMIPRLKLSKSDATKARNILEGYLMNTDSNIVRVMSLQALTDLALQGKIEKEEIIRGIEQYTEIIRTPSASEGKKVVKTIRKVVVPKWGMYANDGEK
jgi:hypothetical protein